MSSRNKTIHYRSLVCMYTVPENYEIFILHIIISIKFSKKYNSFVVHYKLVYFGLFFQLNFKYYFLFLIVEKRDKMFWWTLFITLSFDKENLKLEINLINYYKKKKTKNKYNKLKNITVRYSTIRGWPLQRQYIVRKQKKNSFQQKRGKTVCLDNGYLTPPTRLRRLQWWRTNIYLIYKRIHSVEGLKGWKINRN